MRLFAYIGGGADLILRKRWHAPKPLLRVAVCYVESAVTRTVVDRLTQLDFCTPLPFLSDEPENVLWSCRKEQPDVLLLETMPDAMERFDDPSKDIAGRCETAARVREELPDCRVYLTCAEEFRRLEPVMQKAVDTRLIDGYCFGALTSRLIESWLPPH